jgi:hypothetical protein
MTDWFSYLHPPSALFIPHPTFPSKQLTKQNAVNVMITVYTSATRDQHMAPPNSFVDALTGPWQQRLRPFGLEQRRHQPFGPEQQMLDP